MEQCKTIKELKRKYKSLCLKHHPDKGGEPEEFKKITEIYEERFLKLNKGKGNAPVIACKPGCWCCEIEMIE